VMEKDEIKHILEENKKRQKATKSGKIITK
jgi:hypothetical protein